MRRPSSSRMTGRRSPPVVPMPVRGGRRRRPGARRPGQHSATQRALARGARGLGATSDRLHDRATTPRRCRAHGDGAVVLLHTWPGGTGEGIGPMIAGLASSARRSCRSTSWTVCRDQDARPSSPSTPAVRRATSPSSGATARSWAPPGCSAVRSTAGRGSCSSTSRSATWCRSASRSRTRRVRAGLDPERPARRRTGCLLPRRRRPTGGRPPAPSMDPLERMDRDGGAAQRHVRGAARRAPTVRGASASSAGTGRTAPRWRRTAAITRFPAIGPISGDWGGGGELGSMAAWHAVAIRGRPGQEDGAASARSPRTSA